MAKKKSSKKSKKKKSNSAISKAVNSVATMVKNTAASSGGTSASSSVKQNVSRAVATVKKTAESTSTKKTTTVNPVLKNATPLKRTTFKTTANKNALNNYKKDAKAGKFGKSVQNSLNGKKTKKKKDTYYTTGNNNVAALVKTNTAVQGTVGATKNYADVVREHLDTYGSISDADKAGYRNRINATLKEQVDEANRKTQKDLGEHKVKVEKLTKSENEAYSKAKIRGTYAAMQGGAARHAAHKKGMTEEQFLKNNPDVTKKLTKQQVADYEKHPVLYGVAEGALPVNVDNKKLRKYYTDKQAEAIDRSKDTKQYKAGYAAGTIGSFFVGGGGGAIESGIKTGLKGAMKVGAKKVVKETAEDGIKLGVKTATKSELKSIVKKSLKGDVKKIVEKEIKQTGKSATLEKIVDNTWNSLKLTGKDKAKSFIASRAADAAVSTPFNIADALKQSTNAKGETDYKEAAKAFGLNTATDMAIGGVVDGASILSKGGTYKKLTQIMGKRNMGQELTKEEVEWYNKTMDKIRSENASRRELKGASKAQADYEGTGVNVMKLADDIAHGKNVLKKQVEALRTQGRSDNEILKVLQKRGASPAEALEAIDDNVADASIKAVDSNSAKAYNLNEGGVTNGNRQMGQKAVSADSRGTTNIRQVDEGVSGRERLDRTRVDESARTEGLGRTRMGDESVTVKPETRTKMTDSGIVDTKLSSSDYAVFSRQLDNAIEANKHGAYVDAQNIESLKRSKAKTFLSDDGSAGVAVKSDGDIVGVFNAGTKYRGAAKDLIVTARANGGAKMDCYGMKLVNTYENAGFVPVARVPFNAEYVDDALLLSKKPDVYVMMKNSDSIDDVIDKMGKRAYKQSTQAELDALPTFNDYDEALAYRDSLLARQEASVDASSLGKLDISSSDNGRPDMTSPKYNAGRGSDQLPSINSKNGVGNESVSTTIRPDSVTTYSMDAPPNKSNISVQHSGGKGNSVGDFIEQAKKASENAKYTEQFDTANEKIKYDNPEPRKHLARAVERISPEEVPHARQTAVKLANQVDDDVAEIVEPWVRDGLFNKKIRETQKAAIKRAEREAEDGTLYQRFMDMDFEKSEHLFMARAKVLLERLSKAAVNDDDAAKALLEVMDKATDASSHAGRMLNATKLLLRTTPEGRLRVANKEALRLQEKYANRLGGKAIELSDEQIQRILKAETDEEIAKTMEEINLELWENIPATWLEKMNEIRHFSMLANPKTHLRNLAGNAAFKACRNISDGIEIAIYKVPAVRRRIENLGSSVEMVKVSHKELKMNKKYLNEVFDTNYGKANSKQRYIETTRPDGAPIIRTKWLNALIQKNYGLLEKEDVVLTLKHEYKKNYVRWAKSKGVPLDNLQGMSKAQKRAADAFAMKQAEIATFRDNSAMANAIVRFKEKTVQSDKLTMKAANMALESTLPFVKTPVNVMRRSIDYSPISLLRAMNNLRKASDAEALKLGIHQLSTGLTGTGVFLLGACLAANDIITVDVGKVSGDEYYDRDMGYQDYSLRLHFGDKEYSFTIDWLAPMQSSLFMGANTFQMLQKDGITTRDIFDGFTKVLDPMLDMSFMSSAKDTVEMFMETAYRDVTKGEDPNFGDAIMTTLFGSIPQGYMNSFVPQIVSQTAGLLDDKQRDTRSTRKDPLGKSWESWSRKMVNRIPVLRQKVLNPKIDRFGNDVETGGNIVLRVFNAYVNPSNVKQIHFTKLDKEIIDIYNHMPDGEDKNFFFYNFTGNPSYELANGKRMSYEDLYKYGKRSRQDQTKSIKLMTESESYENMSYGMKAKEVESAHWNAEMVADKKTYGSKYLLDKALKNENSSKTDVAAIKLARSSGTVSDDDLANYMIRKEKLIARCHETDYYTQAIAIALYGSDEIMKVYGVNSDKVAYAREYVTKYGDGAYKMFSDAECNVISGLDKAGASTSTKNKAISAADFDINEDTYMAMGIDADTANMGYGIKKFEYSYEALENMKMNAKYGFDSDNSGTLNKDEIIEYIESLGLETDEEKAVLFAYFSDAKNPYGGVPNYLGFNGTSSGGKGSKRRSGGGGRSKSGSSSSQTSKVPSWEEWVKDYLTTGDELKRTTFKNWDSPIDSAYIKKIQKLIKNKPSA